MGLYLPETRSHDTTLGQKIEQVELKLHEKKKKETVLIPIAGRDKSHTSSHFSLDSLEIASQC